MKAIRIILPLLVLFSVLGWPWLFPPQSRPEALVISRHLAEDASKIHFFSSRQHFSAEWIRDGAIWTDSTQDHVISPQSIAHLLGSLSSSLPTIRGLTLEKSGLALQDRSIEIDTLQGTHYQIVLGLPLVDGSGIALSFGPHCPIQAAPLFLEAFYGMNAQQHFTTDLMPLGVETIQRFTLETRSGRSQFTLRIVKDAPVASEKTKWVWDFAGNSADARKFSGPANSDEVLNFLKELGQVRSQESPDIEKNPQSLAKFEFWREDATEPYRLTISKAGQALYASRGKARPLRLPSEGEVNFDSLHERLSQRSLLPAGSNEVTRLEFTLKKTAWVLLKNAQGWSKFSEVSADSNNGGGETDAQSIKVWLDTVASTHWQINKDHVRDEKPELLFDTRMFDSKNKELGSFQLQFYSKKRLNIRVAEKEFFSLEGDEVARLRVAAERVLGSSAK